MKKITRVITVVTLFAGLCVNTMVITDANGSNESPKKLNNNNSLYAGVSYQLSNIDIDTTIIKDEGINIVGSSYESKPSNVTKKLKKGYINSKAKVRNRPSSEADVFESYKTNTKVEYYEENNLWVRIEYEDGWAFISSKQISDNKVLDLTCEQTYTAKKFRKAGRVKYEGHTYTFYSELVLPGGGLKIPNRHNELIDGLYFVCDKDGYIVVACDFLKRGTIVDTPVGRKGKVYDTGAGKNNIDLYVHW